jgi:hypothetical protein
MKSEYNLFAGQGCRVRDLRRGVIMADGKLLQFPLRNPDLFSQEINCQVLRNSGFNNVLYAAIRALPHIQDSHLRHELKNALCDLVLQQNGAA